MEKYKLNFNSGDVCLEFDGKKILKGAAAAMLILNCQFNQDISNNINRNKVDEYIEDYLYRLSNITDKDGNVYDIIYSIRDGKIFDYFPLVTWIDETQSLGRKLIALRFIQYFSNSKEFDKFIDRGNLIIKLKYIIQNSFGLLQEHAKLALSIVQGASFKNEFPGKPMDRENPLNILELQENLDYLKVAGVKIKKGSIGLFLKSLQIIFMQRDSSNKTDAYKQAILDSEQAAIHIEKLGFFKFFDKLMDWENILQLVGDIDLKWTGFIPYIPAPHS